MIKKIKQLLLVTVMGLGLLSPGLLAPVLGGVASADIAGNVCSGSQAASDTTGGCKTSGDPTAGLTSLAKTVTKWFSIIVGAVSIVMIIYGGFRYITSGGSSEKVGSAKNTLIYAIIGLIIVALAQLIVNVVITQSSNTTSSFQ